MFWKRGQKTADKNNPVITPSATPDHTIKTSATLPLSFLKKLIPIGQLADKDLQQLTIETSQYKAGDIIFNRGETSNSLLYLSKGQCYLETKHGSGYLVDESVFKALYPLSSDTLHQCTAIAKSAVSIIHFSHEMLQISSSQSRNPLLKTEDIPEYLKNNHFFNTFCQSFKQGKLEIPSLPDVALKLRTAVQKNIGVHEAVKIINLDPVISSKLIKIVNSPVYRPVDPISTCHDAVTRLGLTTTRNLVTSISMQNLFKSKNKELNDIIHKLWKQSIRVSSISHTLAILTKQDNSDEALLAGLIHNIGAIPIITFANTLSKKDYSKKDLALSIKTLQGLIGNIILNDWDFPENLLQIPSQTENLYHNNNENLDLCDIVILAKYHSAIDNKRLPNLPPLQTLPAFQKLGDNTLTPEMSLQALDDAKQQISDAISIFSS